MDIPLRLIADAMLGSLAKWLRIMGFDTLYFRDIADNELVRLSRKEGRLLLTRDNAIARGARPGEFLLIHSEKTMVQLREVISETGVPAANQRSPRCSVCNGRLLQMRREEIRDVVPEYVYSHCSAFAKCNNCGKVYWEGSHKKIIDAVISDIIGKKGDQAEPCRGKY
jgi:uncharacterized protein with PIN domain